MNSAHHMRLDVLAAAVQEIARALAPAQAAAMPWRWCGHGLRCQLELTRQGA